MRYEQYSSSHGVDPWCYKSFTNTLRILKQKNSDISDIQALCPSKKNKSHTKQSSFQVMDLDFVMERGCRSLLRKNALSDVKPKQQQNAIKAASDKQDQELLKKISGIDLLAREAHCHSFCRKEYTHPKRQHESGDKITSEQVAHKSALITCVTISMTA